ncbi:hypothetical protein [Bdellovibrio sp. HCB2-146]|uniref:hypothetical protein n=1 Tax=Bdellovibrio sp. HCB2-146 TaxID=3394362 RepID=UPI0039BC8B54
MRALIIASIYLGAFFLLSACAQESGSLYSQDPQPVPPPVVIPEGTKVPTQQFGWITNDGGESEVDFNPRVDILFVIDNSDSMAATQDSLVKNINRFTSGIVSNKVIDYHIGVISTWDNSENFAKLKKDTYGIGELRAAKNAQGVEQSKRFIDRSDSPQALAATLKIGIAPLVQGGPENEEFFAPLLAAIEKSGRGAANEEFFREDAQLVVVFVTDADDYNKNNISHEQVAQALVDFKKDPKKVSVYGALVGAKDPDTKKDWALRIHPKYNEQCFNFDAKGKATNNGTCTGFGPEKIESLIYKVNKQTGMTDAQIRNQYVMSILSPKFGDELGRLGDDIKKKILEKEIFLSQSPRFDEKTQQYQIVVRYGKPDVLAKGKGQIIPMDKQKGWSFTPPNIVKISGNLKAYEEGAKFAVDFVPVNLNFPAE